MIKLSKNKANAKPIKKSSECKLKETMVRTQDQGTPASVRRVSCKIIHEFVDDVLNLCKLI